MYVCIFYVYIWSVSIYAEHRWNASTVLLLSHAKARGKCAYVSSCGWCIVACSLWEKKKGLEKRCPDVLAAL